MGKDRSAYFAYDHYYFAPISPTETKVCLDLLYRSMDSGALKNFKISITDSMQNPNLSDFFAEKRKLAVEWLQALKLQIENSAIEWNNGGVQTQMYCPPSVPSHMRIVVKNARTKQIRDWLYQQYKSHSTMITTGAETRFASRFAARGDLDDFFEMQDRDYYARDSYSFRATAEGLEVCLDVQYVLPNDNPPETLISISESSRNKKFQEKLYQLQKQATLWLRQLKNTIEQEDLTGTKMQHPAAPRLQGLNLKNGKISTGWDELDGYTNLYCSPYIPDYMRVRVKNTTPKKIRNWLYQQYHEKNLEITVLGETRFASRFVKNGDLDAFFAMTGVKYDGMDDYGLQAAEDGVEVCLNILHVLHGNSPLPEKPARSKVEFSR